MNCVFLIQKKYLAAATEGISHEEGLDAITSTSLVNQSFKQITENFSMKLLAANLQLAGQTAMIEQLTDFALSKHRTFDWNMLLDTMVTNALSQDTAKVFGAISPITVEINSVTSGLLNQAFLNQRFNVFEVEAAAVGTFIGNEGGKSLNDTIKPYTKAARAAQAQKRQQQTLLKNLNTLGEIFGEEGANDVASTTPSTTKPASSTQQGLNQFGLFGSGSKKTPSQLNQDAQTARDVAAMVSFYDGNIPGYPGGGTGMTTQNSTTFFSNGSNGTSPSASNDTMPTLFNGMGYSDQTPSSFSQNIMGQMWGYNSGAFGSGNSLMSGFIGEIEKPLLAESNALLPLAAMLPKSVGQLAIAGLILESYGVNGMQGYVADHGNFNIDLSLGAGLAGEFDINISKQGVTTFFGLGVGLGASVSYGTGYEFKDAMGFTSRTTISSSLGPIPVRAGAALTVSQSGPALSTDIQLGEGSIVETVTGFSSPHSWEQVQNYVNNLVP